MILLLAELGDPHAAAVEAALRGRGKAIFRLDCTRAHHEIRLLLQPGTPHWRLESREEPGRALDSATISAVYLRRWGSLEAQRRLAQPDSAHLDQAEVFEALRRLVLSLPPELFPLGHPAAQVQAENKLRQLQVAGQVGFPLANSLYANDSSALAEFARKHEWVVVKPLSHPSVQSRQGAEDGAGPAEQLLWCRAYRGAQLAGRIAAVRHTQLFLQEAISKCADLRIIVLPGRIFACEIDSSSLPPEEPDFRQRTRQLPHRLIKLPNEFEERLRKYLEQMNLRSGHFDFARRPDGETVFLECNPNGQWLWVERLSGAPIAEAIAEALA